MAEYRDSYNLDTQKANQSVNNLRTAFSNLDKATAKNLDSFRVWQNNIQSKADSLAHTLRVKIGESYKYADAAARQHQKILRQEVAASYRAADIEAQRYQKTIRQGVSDSYKHADAAARRHQQLLRNEVANSYRAADIAAQRYHNTLRNKVAASYRAADAAAMQHTKRLREETAASYRAADAQAQRWNKTLRGGVNDMNAMDAAFERINARIKQFASFILAAMIIRGFSQAVRGTAAVIIEFDQALYSLQAITRANTHEARLMGDAILDVARKTKFSAGEVAAGMELIGRAGFSAAESIHSIEAVANLATGTLESFEDVVDLMTTTMRAFHMESVQASEISDVFANAINNSKLTVDKLSTAFNYVGAASYQAGLTLNETTGSLMLLANAGVRASTMGTGLRRTFLNLLNPNQRLRDALHSVGMEIDDMNPRMVGWEQVLRNVTGLIYDFEEGAVDMGLAASFFGARAAQAVAVLVDAVGSGGALTMAIESTREIGAAARMAALQQEGLANQFKNLQDRTKLVAIAMGDAGLNGVISAVVNNLRWLMGTLEDLFRYNKAFAEFVAIGASVAVITAAVAALGAALKFVMPMLLAIGAVAKAPLTLIVVGLVAATTVARYFTDRTEKLAQAHEKAAVEIMGSVDAINSWERALNSAADATDRQYMDTMRRYIEENKELSQEILNIVNNHQLMGDEVHNTWNSLLAAAGSVESINEIMKEAFSIQRIQKFKASIDEDLGAVQQRFKDYYLILESIDRLDPSNALQAFHINKLVLELEELTQEMYELDAATIRSIENMATAFMSLADETGWAMERVLDEIAKLKLPPSVEIELIKAFRDLMGALVVDIESFQAKLKDLVGMVPAELQKAFSGLSLFDQIQFLEGMDKIEKEMEEFKDKVKIYAQALEASLNITIDIDVEVAAQRAKLLRELMEKLSTSVDDGTKSISDFQKTLNDSIKSYEQRITLLGKDERETAKWTETFKLGLKAIEELPPVLDKAIDAFFDLKEAAENVKTLEKVLKEASDTLSEMTDPLDSMEKQFQEWRDAIGETNEELEKLIANIKIMAALDEALKFQEELKEELDKTKKIVAETIHEYNEKIDALYRTAEEQEIYTAIVKLGNLATDEEKKAVREVIEEYHNKRRALKAEIKAQEDLVKAQEERIKKYERIWEQMFDNIQSANAKTIRDMLDGNLDKWEDYADAIVDIMKNALAEIAAAYLQEQIIMRIMPQMGAAQGVAGSVSSGPGGLVSSAGKLFGGGGSAGGGSMGGMSMGTMGIIGAAIIAQLYLSGQTDTVVEGHPTGNAKTGDYMTEPWLAYMNQQMGWGPTHGQGFDAAMANKDYGLAFARSFSAADYWANPIGGFVGNAAMGVFGAGSLGHTIFDPIGGITHMLGFGASEDKPPRPKGKIWHPGFGVDIDEARISGKDKGEKTIKPVGEEMFGYMDHWNSAIEQMGGSMEDFSMSLEYIAHRSGDHSIKLGDAEGTIAKWTKSEFEKLPWDQITGSIFEHMVRSAEFESENINKAIDNINFESVETAMADLSFAFRFDDTIAALTSGIEEMRLQIDAAAQQEVAGIIAGLEQQMGTTERLGLDTEALTAAQQEYVKSMVLGRETMTQAEAELYALEARFREFEKALIAVGYSAEEAADIAAEGWKRAQDEMKAAQDANFEAWQRQMQGISEAEYLMEKYGLTLADTSAIVDWAMTTTREEFIATAKAAGLTEEEARHLAATFYDLQNSIEGLIASSRKQIEQTLGTYGKNLLGDNYKLFEDWLSSINTLTTEQLTAALDEIDRLFRAGIIDAETYAYIHGEINSELNEAGDKFQDAADTIQNAANTMWAASRQNIASVTDLLAEMNRQSEGLTATEALNIKLLQEGLGKPLHAQKLLQQATSNVYQWQDRPGWSDFADIDDWLAADPDRNEQLISRQMSMYTGLGLRDFENLYKQYMDIAGLIDPGLIQDGIVNEDAIQALFDKIRGMTEGELLDLYGDETLGYLRELLGLHDKFLSATEELDEIGRMVDDFAQRLIQAADRLYDARMGLWTGPASPLGIEEIYRIQAGMLQDLLHTAHYGGIEESLKAMDALPGAVNQYLGTARQMHTDPVDYAREVGRASFALESTEMAARQRSESELLREEVIALRKEIENMNENVSTNTSNTATTLSSWDDDGAIRVSSMGVD